jgi:hypothetical protein
MNPYTFSVRNFSGRREGRVKEKSRSFKNHLIGELLMDKRSVTARFNYANH